MTPTEATTLASTAHQPDLAPLCEQCGEPKTTGFSSHGAGRKSWYCRPCVQAQKDRPPICECGLPKERLNAGRGHGTYWGCRPCRNRRSLEAYNARKAGGMALSSFKAMEVLAAMTEARKAPPKPEKPLLPCHAEHRDYWSAARRLGLRGIR